MLSFLSAAMISDSSPFVSQNGTENTKTKPKNEEKNMLPKEVDIRTGKDMSCTCFGYTRFVILIVGLLCMTATRANEMSFNLTVICMTSNSSIDGVIILILVDSAFHSKKTFL